MKWFSQLKYLIEYAFKLNNETKVTLLAHSMGAPMVLYFLQQQKQVWKDKYISRIITLNGAWGGTVQSIEAIAEGYNFGSNVVSQDEMRMVQRSSPSLHWLTPHPHLWTTDDVFMSSPHKNYTVQNYKEFFMYDNCGL